MKKRKKDPLVEELRQYIKQNNVSVPKVAGLLDAAPKTVYRWLKYEVYPTGLYRKAIESLLKGE